MDISVVSLEDQEFTLLNAAACDLDRQSTLGSHDEAGVAFRFLCAAGLQVESSQDSGQGNFQLMKSKVLANTIPA